MINTYQIKLFTKNKAPLLANSIYCEIVLNILKAAKVKYKFKLYGFSILSSKLEMLIGLSPNQDLAKIIKFMQGEIDKEIEIFIETNLKIDDNYIAKKISKYDVIEAFEEVIHEFIKENNPVSFKYSFWNNTEICDPLE